MFSFLNSINLPTLSPEHLIVGATGIGYLIVGVLQGLKGEAPNAMIWLGYAFAQVGLWLNIK
jgi:hypothetical protein